MAPFIALHKYGLYTRFMKKLFLLTLLLNFNAIAFEVDQQRLSKVAAKFIKTNKNINAYEASCSDLYQCERFTSNKHTFENNLYRYHAKTYHLPVTRSQFFMALTSAHPKEIWQGDSRFELSIDQANKKLFYKDENHPGLRVGNIVLLELTARVNNVLKTKIPVAFKIIEMDESQGIVSFSYLKQNKSKGIQKLQITELPDGTITVLHASRFQSGSDFRDDYMYAPIHEKLTDDFYEHLEKLIIRSF
jgi:hypothetical protein